MGRETVIFGEMDMGKWSNPLSESEFLDTMKSMADKNQVFKSYQGTGYYGVHVPPVILRNVLENPGWYTQYTPYQAEIAQARDDTVHSPTRASYSHSAF